MTGKVGSENRTTSRGPPSSWRALLVEAVNTPGLVHEAYTRFHRYSLHNQLLAWAQCVSRGVTPGPLATFKQWQAMGRFVQRGEKALTLCVPITIPAKDVDNGEEKPPFFVYRSRWFALSQTEGREYEPLGVPGWTEAAALKNLDITHVPFEALDGNTQGYALSGRRVAVSPVAGLPHRTLFHELAHVILQHHDDGERSRALKEVEAESVVLLCLEALDLPGTIYARGYLGHYLQHDEISEESAQRAIQAAQQILAAGAEDSPG